MECGSSRDGRFRPVLTTVTVLVLLVLMWVGLEVYFAMTARPGSSEGWVREYAALLDTVHPEGSNDWDVVVAACEAHEASINRFQAAGGEFDRVTAPYYFFYGADSSLLEPNPDSTQEFLDAAQSYGISESQAKDDWNRAASLYEEWLRGVRAEPWWDVMQDLQSIRRAVVVPTDQDQLITDLIDVSGPARAITKTLDSMMILARRDKDWAAYEDCFETNMALGWSLGSQPVLVARLVAVAMQAHTLNEVAYAAEHDSIPSASLERLQEIERQWRLPDRRYTFEGERLFMLDGIARAHDQRGRRILGGPHAPESLD